MTQKTLSIGVLALLVIVGGVYYFSSQNTPVAPVTSFEECVAAGNPVSESYLRQCTSKDGTHFTENIGNELEKTDLIQISSPRPNDEVASPLAISGQARGAWFFEGSFPVLLAAGDGTVIAQGIATAQGEWMTNGFVPFTATLTFTTPDNSSTGTLVLKKDNPSGLPEKDDELEIPVLLAQATSTSPQGIAPFHSGIRGTVMLGPTCPVEKDPPDPNCADKPYQTAISIARAITPRQVFATAESDASGSFQVSLPPGDYVVTAEPTSKLPQCTPVSTTVAPIEYVAITISCDTGIR